MAEVPTLAMFECMSTLLLVAVLGVKWAAISTARLVTTDLASPCLCLAMARAWQWVLI
jgi:hypothetical protein